MNNSRYDGEPLLRILECYVLWAIGELDADQARILESMTPKLQSVYGVEGKWHEIISRVMDLPNNLPEKIRELWRRKKNIENNLELTAQEFAEMFVDQNLREENNRDPTRR